MTLHRHIARTLYDVVSAKRFSFHTALRLMTPTARLRARGSPPSTQLRHRSVLAHLIEATDPRRRSAWTSVLFPAELLWLFDVYPLTLEAMGGLFASLGLAQEFLAVADADDIPPTMCSFHRYLLGFSKSHFAASPTLVGATSLLCDGNLKSFAEAAKEQHVPFFFLDLPHDDGEEAAQYVKEQLARMVEALSDLTGIACDAEKMRRIVRHTNDAVARMNRLSSMRREKDFNVQRGHEIANFIFPFHFLLGSERLLEMLDAIVTDYEAGRSHRAFDGDRFGAGCRRLMWLHIVPQYDTPMWQIIDDGKRSRVVCDEYSSQPLDPYDPSDPLGSIARRLLRHPSNGPLERRVDHVLRVARAFRVDGIVHYASWGCHQAAGNVPLLGQAIESAGFKFININGDAVDARNSSFEQHRTRLEAFLESLEGRR
jgi:benzoyl-CoA reductase/2-hydroxyglutaryl-CoA dehydratase subunit BcrC/BadD/HgdB